MVEDILHETLDQAGRDEHKHAYAKVHAIKAALADDLARVRSVPAELGACATRHRAWFEAQRELLSDPRWERLPMVRALRDQALSQASGALAMLDSGPAIQRFSDKIDNLAPSHVSGWVTAALIRGFSDQLRSYAGFPHRVQEARRHLETTLTELKRCCATLPHFEAAHGTVRGSEPRAPKPRHVASILSAP